MINFTVGPVQMNEEVRDIGAEQIPYFRTLEFSKIMLENEKMFLRLADAGDSSRAIFITGSGTAAMEAAVINVLTENDKALIINGGSFGQRFVDLCNIHQIPCAEIKLRPGKKLQKTDLNVHKDKGYTCLLVNAHETSTGVHYNLNMLKEFCEKNQLIFIVDAISSFLADEISMKQHGIDVLIAGSQKALAVPPGISILAMSEKAICRVNSSETKCMYLDLKRALADGKRGQTPFTPAVGILLQLHKRLTGIEEKGIEQEIHHVKELAEDFRQKVCQLPFSFFSEEMSNAVTALKTNETSAKTIFQVLKDEYHIWICPNGGELAEKVFRVGHIGNLTLKDNEELICALYDMEKRGILK